MGKNPIDFLSDNRENYVVMNYWSENWFDATEKFVAAAEKFGTVKWMRHPPTPRLWGTSPSDIFDIPYVSIGRGKSKIVINSGVHGLEGYFGSVAQIMFLTEIAPKLSPEILSKYTIVLIHVINGWGMENRMREVMDPSGGLVDLNRNFGVDFSRPDNLPRNDLYKHAHDILLSTPHLPRGFPTKLQQLLKFFYANQDNGVWASISRGQYTHPYGLFYGGASQTPENKMTLEIYDDVMQDADSLISVGLHTGLGRFYKKQGRATSQLVVSHPDEHKSTKKFILF